MLGVFVGNSNVIEIFSQDTLAWRFLLHLSDHIDLILRAAMNSWSEKWWGGHVRLNAEEMQFIVDQLFIGNRLATGELTFSDGTRVDLRAIQSPIIVFCSEGDDITPPAQALSWITDLYGDLDDLPQSLSRISTAGALDDEDPETIGRWIDAAVAGGLLVTSRDQYRTLSLTSLGRDVLNGTTNPTTVAAPGATHAAVRRWQSPRCFGG